MPRLGFYDRIMSEDGYNEATIISDAYKLRGLDWVFTPEDDDEGDELEDLDMPVIDAAERQRRADLIRGLLWNASVSIIDYGFDDLHALYGGADAADTHVFGMLPPRFAPYDILFANQFLVALVDVTVRLANHWEPLPTVAHELAMRCILNEAESIAFLAECVLPEGWRQDLEEDLFEDIDHEFLYDSRGIETTMKDLAGMMPMDRASWFLPFSTDNMPAPYATVIPDPPA